MAEANGGGSATRSRSTRLEFVQPIGSAITVAGADEPSTELAARLDRGRDLDQHVGGDRSSPQGATSGKPRCQ